MIIVKQDQRHHIPHPGECTHHLAKRLRNYCLVEIFARSMCLGYTWHTSFQCQGFRCACPPRHDSLRRISPRNLIPGDVFSSCCLGACVLPTHLRAVHLLHLVSVLVLHPDKQRDKRHAVTNYEIQSTQDKQPPTTHHARCGMHMCMTYTCNILCWGRFCPLHLLWLNFSVHAATTCTPTRPFTCCLVLQ